MAKQADSANDEGLEMLSRLFEEEVPQQEMLERLILPVPSSVEEHLHRHYENVLARNEELESKVCALEQENKTLQEKNDLLRNNLTALYRTSLAEIRFRNLQIASLRKQLHLPVTAVEEKMSSDCDQSSSISKQSTERTHGSENQGNVFAISRTEIVSSVSGCSVKGTEKTDERRDLMTDAFSSGLNLCVSSSSSSNDRVDAGSSFSPQLSVGNTTTCGLTDVSVIVPGTDMVSVNTLGVGREAQVSLGVTVPVQPSTCDLLKPGNRKSQDPNAFSAVDGCLQVRSCSSISYSAAEDSASQGVQLEPSLSSSNPVMTSDRIASRVRKHSSSGMMAMADREGKAKAEESILGDKCSAETLLVNRELLGCTTATSSTSKINAKDSEQNTITNKKMQNNFEMDFNPKKISLPFAAHKSDLKAASLRRKVSSEPVEFVVSSEAKNDGNNLSSTVLPNKTGTSAQTKVSISSSIKDFQQTEFHSHPGRESQDSVNEKTTQQETLAGNAGVVRDKSHCPVEGIRLKENEPVESSSHSGFEKIDSAVEKTKPKVKSKISKTGSESVGKHYETSKCESLLDNDLRLKLVAKSKADVLHVESSNALCSTLSKRKVIRLEKESETSSEWQGLSKENSRAGKADTSDPSVLGLNQETSSHPAHHAHRRKSETGEPVAFNQSSKLKARNDLKDQEWGIENNDERQTRKEADKNCKGADGPSHKRKLSGSDTELPAKKGRSGDSIQDRLMKISTLKVSVSEEPSYSPEENSSKFHQERRKLVTPSSNAKNLPKENDLISRLAPEIEKLKRYVAMAEEHDIAQVISLKEGEKHLSRLAAQKKMLDCERVPGNVPVETAVQLTSSTNQKKPLNEHNTPSLTVFTLRSMAKLKQASLSRTNKQVRHNMEKGSSEPEPDSSVVTTGREATNNLPEVHDLAATALVQGNVNSGSLETSLPKVVCSSQNEKPTVVSEQSDVFVGTKHEPKSCEKKFDVKTSEALGTRSSSSKKSTRRKRVSSENVKTAAVQEATTNTLNIQSMETSTTQPSEDVSQNNLLSPRQDLINETNIKEVDSIFDSGCKRNQELKLKVKQPPSSLLMSSKSKTYCGTEQNNEVHSVSQVEQPKGSMQSSADRPTEALQSRDNFSQAYNSLSKLICSSTPMEVNSDLYLGTKVGKGIVHKEDSLRDAGSGEDAASDVDVPVAESNSQNSNFDFLFDVAIAGATPAHVSDTITDYENESIHFDQDFFANFAVEQNCTEEVTEAGQGNSGYSMAENAKSTGSQKQNIKADCNADRDAESDVVDETRNAFGDNSEQVMADNALSSDPGTSSDKEVCFEQQNLQESKKNRNSLTQVDNEICVKNREISNKITNWPTADVDLAPSSAAIEDEDPSPQISPFKLFLHNSDKQREDGKSIPGKPSGSFSPVRREDLLKETLNLTDKSKAPLQSDETEDLAAFSDAACSDSELLQVHALEESFDFYLSDTNDRLFGSVSVSPSSFMSPELEDGEAADGMSKTTALKAKELSVNNLEFEEGEINDSERDFPVDFGGKTNYTKGGQTVRDERSVPRRFTKKKSFNGWHSRGHHYGKSRSERFSRETPRSEVEPSQKNSQGIETKQKFKARSPPHRSHSPEIVTNAPSAKKGRLGKSEDEATRHHHKESRDRTHSQDRTHSRHSEEHSKCNSRYERRQRSRVYDSSETRRHRITK